MQLRWTQAVATDLERIADYLFSQAPDRAPRLIRSIYEAPETLLSFPHSRAAGEEGWHTTGAFALPWLEVTTVRDDVVNVLRILDGGNDGRMACDRADGAVSGQ